MRISVYASDSNPFIDRFLLRKPVHYCEREVAEGRARLLDPADITCGIQLIPSNEYLRKQKVEHRGSLEAHGCLTANESSLNAEYRGKQDDVALLALEYEHRLEHHEAEGRKGMPRGCAVIAARVKTILSDPDFGRTVIVRVV